jgi:hypothetical protein
MKNTQRYAIAAAALLVVFFLVWIVWPSPTKKNPAPAGSVDGSPTAAGRVPSAPGTTTVYAHNLELRKGPLFRIYVRWIRGQMVPTHVGVPPSLDDEESFVFRIDRGLIHANLGDITNYLNATMASRSPLKNMKLTGEGQQMKLSGTMHKLLVPLPVEVLGTLSPAPNGRVRIQVNKINVLKMPVKGLLGGLKVEIDDILGKEPVPGVEVKDNDIYLDTTELLPPPHIRGQISSIELHAPDTVVTYGSTAPEDDTQLAQWHNFLRLRGGTLGFGKLTMRDADLTLIDASADTWFDLDLAKYHEQLVKGYSRMTPEKGLEMFLPDVGKALPPGSVSLDTLRDKKKPLPNPAVVK